MRESSPWITAVVWPVDGDLRIRFRSQLRRGIRPTSTAPLASICHDHDQRNQASCQDPAATPKRRWTSESTTTLVFGSSQISLRSATIETRGRRKKEGEGRTLILRLPTAWGSRPGGCAHGSSGAPVMAPPPRAMRTLAGRGLVDDLRGPVTSQLKTELGGLEPLTSGPGCSAHADTPTYAYWFAGPRCQRQVSWPRGGKMIVGQIGAVSLINLFFFLFLFSFPFNFQIPNLNPHSNSNSLVNLFSH
jgi:hypothetical protein